MLFELVLGRSQRDVVPRDLLDRKQRHPLLVFQAQQAGLTLSAEGGQLRIRGPKSAGHLAEALLERKAEVLAYLGCPHPRLLPQTKAAGECLRCMALDEYLATVKMLGERH